MKKIIITMLLILGFGIGANAQNNEISATADKHALNLTKAVHELLGSSVTVDEYTDKCSKIGLEMGLYMANLSEEETEYFLDQFRNSIYYNCAQYGIDKTFADQLIASFNQAFYGNVNEQPVEGVAETADNYARKMVGFIEDAMNGNEDTEAAQELGLEMGTYLAELTSSDIIKFKEEFYAGFEFYISRVDGVDSTTAAILTEAIKEQYDQIFEMFL